MMNVSKPWKRKWPGNILALLNTEWVILISKLEDNRNGCVHHVEAYGNRTSFVNDLACWLPGLRSILALKLQVKNCVNIRSDQNCRFKRCHKYVYYSLSFMWHVALSDLLAARTCIRCCAACIPSSESRCSCWTSFSLLKWHQMLITKHVNTAAFVMDHSKKRASESIAT